MIRGWMRRGKFLASPIGTVATQNFYFIFHLLLFLREKEKINIAERPIKKERKKESSR